MTVETGHFAVLRRSFAPISADQRVQAVIIAFCFGALLEALAGFGTPVAICSVMLIALGLQADQGRVRRARREHRAGRLRRDRDPDRHARPDHRPAQARPRRDGRPPDAVPRPHRAADPRRHGRRPCAASARPGRSRVVGGVVFARRAVRRARTTSRSSSPTSSPRCVGAARSSRFLRVWQPGEPLAAETGDAARRWPAAAPRSTTRASRRGHAPRRRRTPTAARSATRAATSSRLRAVPDHHRRASRSRSPGAGQGLPRRAHQGVRLAGAARAQRQGQGARRRSRSSSTGSPPPARCCWSAGLLTMPVAARRPRAARCAPTSSTLEPAQVGDPHGRRRARARLRDEPLGPDDHARHVGWPGAGGFFAFLSPIIGWLGTAVTGLGHLVQLAVRRAAGGGRQERRPRPVAAGRGQLLAAACSAR